MNTAENLLKQFGTQFPELETVAETYLKITGESTLSRKAAKGDLPFPVFRLSNSQKAPWLVDVNELAHYLDMASKQARKNHQSA